MKTRKIASFNVSAIGLGCMNLSHAYGAPVSAKHGERVLLTTRQPSTASEPMKPWWVKS
jgi:aryl-alcohol dehydrogenase-like predicted oxidoreductase